MTDECVQTEGQRENMLEFNITTHCGHTSTDQDSRDGAPEPPQATAREGDLSFLSIVLLTELFGTGINVGTAIIGSLGGLILIYLRRKFIPEVGMPKKKAN